MRGLHFDEISITQLLFEKNAFKNFIKKNAKVKMNEKINYFFGDWGFWGLEKYYKKINKKNN